MEKTVEQKQERQHKHCEGGNVFWAVFLLSAGLILLLNNFNLLSWQIWEVLWKFWPVIIIFWGIETLSGKSVFANIITGILAILVLAFIFAYSISLVNSSFDRWVGKNYPLWGRLKRNLLQIEKRDMFFECSPFDESCYRFYSN